MQRQQSSDFISRMIMPSTTTSKARHGKDRHITTTRAPRTERIFMRALASRVWPYGRSASWLKPSRCGKRKTQPSNMRNASIDILNMNQHTQPVRGVVFVFSSTEHIYMRNEDRLLDGNVWEILSETFRFLVGPHTIQMKKNLLNEKIHMRNSIVRSMK